MVAFRAQTTATSGASAARRADGVINEHGFYDAVILRCAAPANDCGVRADDAVRVERVWGGDKIRNGVRSAGGICESAYQPVPVRLFFSAVERFGWAVLRFFFAVRKSKTLKQ